MHAAGESGLITWGNAVDADRAAFPAANLTGTIDDARLPTGSNAATVAGKSGKQDIVYRVADYGAISNGTTDDTAAVNAATAACPVGGVVLFPPGNTRITTALSITKPMTLRGSGAYTSRIFADNCGGVVVAAGVTDFRMEAIEVVLAVPYTSTVNALVGIDVLGTTGSRGQWHTYRDVFVNGFKTAFRSGYLWGSVFDHFSTLNGLIGMDIYGLSVNNMVTAAQIQVAGVTGSRGIRFAGQESFTDATPVASEGWIVSDSLIFGAEIGVEGIATCNVDIHDNILDFCMVYGVKIIDFGAFFAGNWAVHDNYIAMTGASGLAGIGCVNGTSNAQNTVNRIHHNHIIAYAGSTCSQGVYVAGAFGYSNIDGNTLQNFGTDILLTCAGNKVTHNVCLSTPGATMNIYSTSSGLNQVEGNTGMVVLNGGNPNMYAVDAMGKRVFSGLQAPTSGAYIWGDSAINCRPTVGQPKGWYCTVAGSPGTWVSTGNL